MSAWGQNLHGNQFESLSINHLIKIINQINFCIAIVYS